MPVEMLPFRKRSRFKTADSQSKLMHAEEYAREKMERLCAAAVELQAALEREPMKAGYNMHVETLAIAAKTATNLARQVRPLSTIS